VPLQVLRTHLVFVRALFSGVTPLLFGPRTLDVFADASGRCVSYLVPEAGVGRTGL
jgi:hypothetical protein